MAQERTAIRAKPLHRVCVAVVAFLLLTHNLAGAAYAEDQRAAPPPKRIVSINACTDQLLFALADRSQIAALSRYAMDDDFSIYSDEVKASGIKLIKGSAEEVLKLKPDLVLAGTFTRRATRELLKRLGVHLALFPPENTVQGNGHEILRAARLFGHEERGKALVAEIERALATAPKFDARHLTVLQFQRRGFVSGPDTLIGDLLRRLGVANAAAELGIKGIARSSLEAALKTKADALVLFDPSARAADQGEAMLFHPALESAYAPSRRIVIPGRLVVCGGPALPKAISVLAGALQRLPARVSSQP